MLINQCQKVPIKSPKYWHNAEPMLKKDFRKMLTISETALSPMTWGDKFATTHCQPLCWAGIAASPLGHWPPTQIFSGRDLRNSSWKTCSLICPQILNNLRVTYDKFIYTGSRVIPTYPHQKYLYQMYPNYLSFQNSQGLLKMFASAQELFIPDLKY